MRKTGFIFTLMIVLLLTGCLNGETGSVKIQFDFPEGVQADQLKESTITVRVAKDSSTFSQTLSIGQTEAVFADLTYGTWNIETILKDAAGQIVLMGNATVTISKKEMIDSTVSLAFAYDIHVTTQGRGKVTTLPNQEVFPSGAVVTVSAISEEGWAFSHWEGDVEGSKETVQVVVDSPKNITAVFVPLTAGIAITFDDWNTQSWYSIKDLLIEYNAKATFFVGRFSTLKPEQVDQLHELQKAGNEIGFHSVNHINAVEFLKSHSVEEYIQQEITPGVQLMRDHGFNPTSFAYPFGARNSALDKKLLECFEVIRGTKYSSSHIRELDAVYCKSKDQRLIYGVGIDDNYHHSIEEIREAIDKAYETNSVFVVYAHHIYDEGGMYTISVAKIREILEYVSARKMRFYTATEIVR